MPYFSYHSFRAVNMNMLWCKNWYSSTFVLDVEPIKTMGFPFSPDLQNFKHVDFALVYLFACTLPVQSWKSVNHKSINSPKDGPDSQSYSPECLSNFRLPTFGFHGSKKKGSRKWSFASLPTCQVKPSPTKWTLSSPDMTGDFARTCQSVSGTHLPTCPSKTPRGAILLLLALADERGDMVPFPSQFPPKIDPMSRVLLGSSESSLSWHIVSKVAICPGIGNPNF